MTQPVANGLNHARQVSANFHEVDRKLKTEQKKAENFNKIENIAAAIFHIFLTTIPIMLAVAVPAAIPICIPMAALCLGLAAWHIIKQPQSRITDWIFEHKIEILKAQKQTLQAQMR